MEQQFGGKLTEVVHRTFEKPDETRTPDLAKIDVVRLGKNIVSRLTIRPGWRWSTHAKPIAKTDSCQLEHLGYVLAGKMVVEFGGKKELIEAGSVFAIPPGHDAYVEGQEIVLLLEFQPETGKSWGRGLQDVSQQ